MVFAKKEPIKTLQLIFFVKIEIVPTGRKSRIAQTTVVSISSSVGTNSPVSQPLGAVTVPEVGTYGAGTGIPVLLSVVTGYPYFRQWLCHLGSNPVRYLLPIVY